MSSVSQTKTPPVLYFLAFLVVAATWWFWQNSRNAPGEQHKRWEGEMLSQSEISEYLANDDMGKICHALVQLKTRLVSFPEKDLPWKLEQSPSVLALKDHENPKVRSYVAYCLAYWPGEAQEEVKALMELLDDDVPLVSLNAAIALAARKNSAGADRLAQAISDTKGEQVAMRRSLLADFYKVAEEKHLTFLENERDRAKLDHDEERLRYCQEAIDRLHEAKISSADSPNPKSDK